MRTQSEIKQYFEETFTDYEGIKTVIVGGYDKVTEATLSNIEYPAIWIMSPFSRKPFIMAGMPRWKWSLDALVLMYAEQADEERIAQNFDDTQALGEIFIKKLYEDATESDSELFDFDDVENVEEWQPKQQYGTDNCNGWLIPITIITT
jgi:hypothetical protein